MSHSFTSLSITALGIDAKDNEDNLGQFLNFDSAATRRAKPSSEEFFAQ